MSVVEVHHGSASDVGLVREVNEDAVLAAPPVFVVADGMGGHDGGDLASAIAVEELGGLLAGSAFDAADAQEALVAALLRAVARLEELDASHHDRGEVGYHAGTTVVAAVLVEHDDEPAWLIAHVGDSRAYGLAADGLHQLTTDHSLVQQLVDDGVITPAQAADHPERHVVTRALGAGSDPTPDIGVVSASAFPRLLLCSDGISDLVEAATLARLLTGREDAEAAARAVVEAALAAGGHDNATALVVDLASLVGTAAP